MDAGRGIGHGAAVPRTDPAAQECGTATPYLRHFTPLQQATGYHMLSGTATPKCSHFAPLETLAISREESPPLHRADPTSPHFLALEPETINGAAQARYLVLVTRVALLRLDGSPELRREMPEARPSFGRTGLLPSG